jgi:tRNA A37 N6-isopentenylltransferase MiaA
MEHIDVNMINYDVLSCYLNIEIYRGKPRLDETTGTKHGEITPHARA